MIGNLTFGKKYCNFIIYYLILFRPHSYLIAIKSINVENHKNGLSKPPCSIDNESNTHHDCTFKLSAISNLWSTPLYNTRNVQA